MAEAPDQKLLDRALKLHDEGRKLKEILELTGLTYAQAWLYITDAHLPASEKIKSKDRTALKVKQLREDNMSWGNIVVRFGYKEYTEAKIRKLFEEATGTMSIGLRIGHGGRFLNNDGLLYAGERRRPGIELPKGTKRSELREISDALASTNGHVPQKTRLASKKAAARASGAVKAAKKAAPVKKATKKTFKATKRTTKEVDPFS